MGATRQRNVNTQQKSNQLSVPVSWSPEVVFSMDQLKDQEWEELPPSLKQKDGECGMHITCRE